MRYSFSRRRRVRAGIAALGILAAPLGAGTAVATGPPGPALFADATLVVLMNTDVAKDGVPPSTRFGKAITDIVTPDHVYDFPAEPAQPSPDNS
ncbi:hypothetical protein AB0B13_00260 [Streptomyces sp. NPDC042898]|uniref:hypothetical protein n=1 Tax=Streptomyces sp. NPDC042898 TaxID=3154334 RepID=UPI0033F1576B